MLLQRWGNSSIYWYNYTGSRNNCNTIIIKDESCVLIDPGHLWNLEIILQKMRRDGINTKDIDVVLNTHCHPDHCESDEFFPKIAKTKISMHELEAKYLESNGKLVYEMFGFIVPNFKINSYLKDSLKLDGIDLEIIHTPGHSPGSICIYWRKRKVLICGDLIFENSFGRTDLPGGDATLIKNSIEKISKLDAEYLLPGHGNIIEGRVNIRNNFNYILKILEHNSF